ncbi:MAG: phosphoribosylglycinamide formyltransferase [Lysobacter sp.]
MSSALRIAVLASGRGSNLQAILDAIGSGDLAAGVVGVFSDRPKAFALERARAAGLPTEAIEPRKFADRATFDEQLFRCIDAVQPDLIVCAGYMRLLGETVVNQRRGRIINIHPSLLPAFKGLRTHQQALDSDAREHGASVHFVTAELDGGPVIAHAAVPVMVGDDVSRLAERVLAREHPLLLATLRLFAAGRVTLVGSHVRLDDTALTAPLTLDSDNHLHP